MSKTKGQRVTPNVTPPVTPRSGQRVLPSPAVKAAQEARARTQAEKRKALQAAAADPLTWRSNRKALRGDRSPGILRSPAQERDSQGRTGAPHVIQDTIRVLERRRDIEPPLARAGRRFRDTAELAQAEILHAAPLERLPQASGRPPEVHHEQAALAMARLQRALLAIGGLNSRVGLVTWYVLGEGLFLREAAVRVRSIPAGKHGERAAKCYLISGLEGLALHYGFLSPTIDP